MNKILILISTLIILLLTGCGGGGKGGGTVTTDDNPTSSVKVAIADCPSTTAMQSGDDIVPDNGTIPVVQITELGDGSKEVCLSDGEAHIER